MTYFNVSKACGETHEEIPKYKPFKVSTKYKKTNKNKKPGGKNHIKILTL